MRLAINDAHLLVQSAMRPLGYDDAEALEIADHLVDSELRGLAFGGLARAVSIADRIDATLQPPGPIRVLRETPSTLTLDGGDRVGYVVAAQATRRVMKKASAQGIAAVGASNTWYTGMFSWYLERITAAGLVGMIAGSAPQMVAPHGGTEGRYGTNPIAFGFPAEGNPVIWDIGTSAVMHGDVVLAQRLGEPLAPGLAIDSDGQPTLDPSAALAGAFAVWGGHKGSGLAIAVHLLGMLAGAPADPVGVADCGFFVVAIDPAMIAGDDYPRRVGEYAEHVRRTRPTDPDRPVQMPFDGSARRRAASRHRGTVEVAGATVTTLRSIARRDTAGAPR